MVATEMSYQEFEQKYSHLLSWEQAEKELRRRLDYNNNFDCCLYHSLLQQKVAEIERGVVNGNER